MLNNAAHSILSSNRTWWGRWSRGGERVSNGKSTIRQSWMLGPNHITHMGNSFGSQSGTCHMAYVLLGSHHMYHTYVHISVTVPHKTSQGNGQQHPDQSKRGLLGTPLQISRRRYVLMFQAYGDRLYYLVENQTWGMQVDPKSCVHRPILSRLCSPRWSDRSLPT